MERPLWRLLLDIQGPEPPPLAETECFALLEFLLEGLAAGCDPQTLRPVMARCLASVPKDWSQGVFARLLGQVAGPRPRPFQGRPEARPEGSQAPMDDLRRET